jgi:hypothetical protein
VGGFNLCFFNQNLPGDWIRMLFGVTKSPFWMVLEGFSFLYGYFSELAASQVV